MNATKTYLNHNSVFALRLRIAISLVTGRAGLFMSIFLLTSFSFFWIISFYPVLSVCLRQYLQPAGYLLACALWVVTSSGSPIKRSKCRPIPRARPFFFLSSSPLSVTPSLHPTDTDLIQLSGPLVARWSPFVLQLPRLRSVHAAVS